MVYYKELEKNQQEVYKLYHDMKNHFMMLENIQKKEEIQNYINGCMGRVRRIEGIVHIGNVYADTMIYDKWWLAGELGIKFMLAVEDNVFVGIEIFDLTILIGNILDNAIEAVQREETDEKKIFFKVWRQGKLSLMMTENTCTHEPKQEDGELVTVKSDKKYHGFGVKNVKEMVKKYRGTVRTEYRNGKFRVLVMVMGE